MLEDKDQDIHYEGLKLLVYEALSYSCIPDTLLKALAKQLRGGVMLCLEEGFCDIRSSPSMPLSFHSNFISFFFRGWELSFNEISINVCIAYTVGSDSAAAATTQLTPVQHALQQRSPLRCYASSACSSRATPAAPLIQQQLTPATRPLSSQSPDASAYVGRCKLYVLTELRCCNGCCMRCFTWRPRSRWPQRSTPPFSAAPP